jgi:hypothetical protein
MPDRTDTHVLKLEAEAVFNVVNGPEAPVSMLVWDLDTASLKRAVIENQATSPERCPSRLTPRAWPLQQETASRRRSRCSPT